MYLYRFGLTFLEKNFANVHYTIPDLSEGLSDRLILCLKINRAFARDMSVLCIPPIIIYVLRSFIETTDGSYFDIFLEWLFHTSTLFFYLISDLGMVLFFTRDVVKMIPRWMLTLGCRFTMFRI